MADLTDLASLKAYAQIGGSAEDGLLQAMLSAYSAAARAYCNRDFTAQDYDVVRDGQGTSKMLLPQFPVTAVAALAIDGMAIPAQAAIGSPGYRFTDSAIILDGHVFTRGFGNVRVRFTAGYEIVPADLAEAVNEWIALRYKERDRIGHASKSLGGETVSFITKAMPDAVKSVLDQYASVAAL
jgi:hypothetical protein